MTRPHVSEQRNQASRIEVPGLPLNPLIANAAHARHQEEVYRFVLEVVEDQRVADADLTNSIGDRLLGEMQGPLLAFYKESITEVGLVNLYHFWERRVRALVREQLGRLGMAVPSEGKAATFVAWAQQCIDGELNAAVDPDLWEQIDEAREVVNAWKHGTSAKIEALWARFPAYRREGSIPPDGDAGDWFVVPRSEFDRLAVAFHEFWDYLPHRAEYRPWRST